MRRMSLLLRLRTSLVLLEPGDFLLEACNLFPLGGQLLLRGELEAVKARHAVAGLEAQVTAL